MILENISKQIDLALAKDNEKNKQLLSESRAKLAEIQSALETSDMQTDKSENAGYEFLINQKQQLQKTIGMFESHISTFDRQYNQYCYENYKQEELTSVGSTVRFVFADGKEFVMKLVPKGAGSPKNGGIAIDSPTGEALVNRKVGDVVNVSTDAVDTTLTIKEVF